MTIQSLPGRIYAYFNHENIIYARDLITSRIAGLPVLFGVVLLIRIFLMPLAVHQDAVFIPWVSYPILEGNFDIYEFLDPIRQKTQGNLNGVIWAPNPPLTYFTMAGWMLLIKKIGILPVAGWDFKEFTAWHVILLPRMLFLTKLIYLAADLIGWYLLRGFVEARRRIFIDSVWLFSPLIFVGTYIMGQTDLLATVWVVIALFFAKRSLDENNKSRWSIIALLSLGIGASYKLWPLLLIPLFSIFLGKKFRHQLGLIIAGFFPFGLVIFPFLGSEVFGQWVLLGHGVQFLQSDTQNWIQNLSLFVLAWGAIHIYLYYFNTRWTFGNLWKSAFLLLLSFFTLNHFWEFYWLVWLLPFVALAVAELPDVYWLHAYQLIHFFLYMIIGWDLGAEVLVRGLANADFAEQRLKNILLGDVEVMKTVLTISFNIFVVASLGLVILLYYAPRSKRYFQIRNPVAISLFQLFLIAAWVFATLLIGMQSEKIRLSDLVDYYANLGIQDPKFFVGLIILIGFFSLMGLLPFVLKRTLSHKKGIESGV